MKTVDTSPKTRENSIRTVNAGDMEKMIAEISVSKGIKKQKIALADGVIKAIEESGLSRLYKTE